MCPQHHSATGLGLSICLSSSWHIVGCSGPPASDVFMEVLHSAIKQQFRQGETTGSAHQLSSCRDLASDMDLHAKDRKVTVLTPSLCNETPSTLLLMYKERD